MSIGARTYVGGVLGASLVLSALALLRFSATPSQWGAFVALTVLATMTQLFKAEAPSHVLFYTSPVFFFAGVLLLPPFLIVPLVAVPHLIEWGNERRRHSPHLRAWYLQPFNIAMNSLTGLSSCCLYHGLVSVSGGGVTAAPVIGGLGAVLCYVLLNHIMLGLALVLARGVSWHDSEMLGPSSLANDLVLACLGLVTATLWQVYPLLLVPALAPLALMYQALMIPQLKHLAAIDSKTGLANAGHFKVLSSAELERASRFERPLAVIMADLDLLRDVNNHYGHLAGDAVLAGIGQIIRHTMRAYDISGRFGGEEFALVAPETDAHTAEMLAERLRQAVADARFPVGTPAVEIGVTMSVGVACYPQDGNSMDELIFAADMAVYEAKTRGRNSVVRAADLAWDRRVAQPAVNAPGSRPSGGTLPVVAGPTSPAGQSVPSAVAAPGEVQRGVLTANLTGQMAPKRLESPAAPTVRHTQLETEQLRHDGATVGTGARRFPDGGSVVRLWRRLEAMFPQPGVAVATVLLAIVATGAALRSPAAAPESVPLGVTLEAMALAAAVIVSYQYPIHIRLHVKVQVSTMAYFWMAALLPLPLALGAAGFGTLLGEMSVRQQRKLYPSDIATAVGRWVLVILLGNVVAHLPGTGDVALVLLAVTALILWVGDLISLPLIVAPMAGERPLRVLRELAVETVVPDGVQYLVGFLGVLAAERAAWALVLFVVPGALVYQAAKHLHEVQDSTHRLLESMAETVDMRDPCTGGHSRRVSDYCAQILREMQLSGPDNELILSAARVHDIGKIAMPDAILNKQGTLTAAEYAIMKTHPKRGAEVLAGYQDFSRGVAMVRHHHEAWDGSGYPQGLKGVAIPFGARVLAVADGFDAMTSDRPYRPGMSVAKAASILRQCRGQQWDPQVVDALLRAIAGQLDEPQGAILSMVPSVAQQHSVC